MAEAPPKLHLSQHIHGNKTYAVLSHEDEKRIKRPILRVGVETQKHPPHTQQILLDEVVKQLGGEISFLFSQLNHH